MMRKGIIHAGDLATGLNPVTQVVSKQPLPLTVKIMYRGHTWLDTGTPELLLQTSRL